MSEKTFTTSSGATVIIRLAPFKDAIALKNAVARELAKSGVDLKLLASEKPGEAMKVDFKSIISALLSVDSSDDVNKALFLCLARCSYNDAKITPEIFEPDAARGDYYQVVLECVQANLLPFFTGLVSKLGGIGQILGQKPPQQQ